MTTRGSRRFLLVACAACCLLPPAGCFAAESKLFGETPRTAQRFAEGAALEKQQRWTEATDLYLRLADEAGDDLAPADDDAHHLVTARRLVHRRIAARPELLNMYRARVEPRAKRLLKQGEAGSDPLPLEQLVDQFFCSRSAEAALHLLGDLACERGEFDQARGYWRLLEAAESPPGLRYPDPSGGPALARAKQILARLLAGERAEAAAELQSFRKAHPNVAGHLAGRDGNFAATLQALLDAADSTRVPRLVGIAPPPNTYGGDATRNGVLRGVLPPFSPHPRYPAILLPGSIGDPTIQRPPVRPEALAFYPVIAHGQVFVTSAHQVLAYDLATGQLSGRYVQPGDILRADEKLPLADGGSFTLTVDSDRIYARLGSTQMRPDHGESTTSLVCLQWQPDQPAPDARLRVRWTLPAVKADSNAPAVWEGSPVIRDGWLYAALTRFDGTRAVSTIVCYPAADPTSGPVWQKDVYETAETADRTKSHLLTLAGPNVVLSSEVGAVVALEAITGRRAWAFRYPTTEKDGPRDPNPCAFSDGRLFVAPADAGRVWCLDAATGAPIWSSDPIHLAHLLGVAHGRVVCSLGGFHAGLCALDADSGRRLPDWGYRVSGADELAPFGRGLLCGDRVYWPTRAAGVNDLRWDGSTGYPPTCFRDLPGGNLAYGDGCLVVATADRMHVLVGESGAGAGPGHRVGQRPALERHDLLLWQADLLRQTGRPAAEVRATLEAATAPAFSPERRFLALVRRAEYEESNGSHQSAIAAAKIVADSDELSRVVIRDANGIIRSAHAWAAEKKPPGPHSPLLTPHSSLSSPGSPVPLHFPLEPAWHVSLDRGHEWALLPDNDPEPGRVCVGGRRWLASRYTHDGSERWRTELQFCPRWLTAVNGSLIVAGDNGIARLSAADGQPAWQFLVPEIAPWFDHPGWRDPEAVAPMERLCGFHWAEGRLVARLGSRSLIAVDGVSGALAWQRLAPMAREYHPAYFADGRCVVAQSSDGQCWAFDTADGRLLHTGPAPTGPWPTPPVALDERRMLVAEEGRLIALDRSTWKPAWTWNLPRPLSLSGDLPQTRLVNGVLLVGVPRNDCYEVEQLNPGNGQPILPDSIDVSTERIDLGALALEGGVLHVATGGELRTFDGRLNRIVERQRLPKSAHWRIEAEADGLLIWTVPVVSATEPPPKSGHVLLVDRSEPERQRGFDSKSSLALGLGSDDVLRSVRIVGNEVVVVSDGQIRGFRGAKREVK